MKILAFSDLHLDEAAADAILAVADRADIVIGAGDFAQRREGASYQAIQAAGGGIASTVAQTRRASLEELADKAGVALREMAAITAAGPAFSRAAMMLVCSSEP